MADQNDLHPTLVMTWMIHALMLVKDEATMTVGVEATAAVGAPTSSPQTLSPQTKPEAEASAHRGSEKEKGIGPSKDTRLLLEDGVTLLQSLHP